MRISCLAATALYLLSAPALAVSTFESSSQLSYSYLLQDLDLTDDMGPSLSIGSDRVVVAGTYALPPGSNGIEERNFFSTGAGVVSSFEGPLFNLASSSSGTGMTRNQLAVSFLGPIRFSLYGAFSGDRFQVALGPKSQLIAMATGSASVAMNFDGIGETAVRSTTGVFFNGDLSPNFGDERSLSLSTAGEQSFANQAFTVTITNSGNSSLTGLLGFFSSSTVTAAIPEPSTYALMFAGLGALGIARRRALKKRH